MLLKLLTDEQANHRQKWEFSSRVIPRWPLADLSHFTPRHSPSLPLGRLASTYRFDFKIQNQGDQSNAPTTRPSQPVPYESVRSANPSHVE
jgi:hypothetical protein